MRLLYTAPLAAPEKDQQGPAVLLEYLTRLEEENARLKEERQVAWCHIHEQNKKIKGEEQS
jgi:hypothetical protein